MTHRKRYLILMIVLIVSLFLSTFHQPWTTILAGVFFLLSLAVAAFSISKSRLQLLILLCFCSTTILPIWHLTIPSLVTGETLNNAVWLTLIFYIGLIIFQDIMKSRRISSDEIYGAISIYLLAGAFFGIIYQTMLLFDPGALYFNPTNFKNLPPTDGESFYYSFITLSTVGYGDVSPASPIARSVSMTEAILGVLEREVSASRVSEWVKRLGWKSADALVLSPASPAF